MRSRLPVVLALVCVFAGTSPRQSCIGDLNGDRQVTTDELIALVDHALNSCAAPKR